MRTIFDQDPEGRAPPDAPVVDIHPASFGVRPDPASAILDASPQVELFDETLWAVPKTWFDPLVLNDVSAKGVSYVAGLLAASRRGNKSPVLLIPRGYVGQILAEPDPLRTEPDTILCLSGHALLEEGEDVATLLRAKPDQSLIYWGLREVSSAAGQRLSSKGDMPGLQILARSEDTISWPNHRVITAPPTPTVLWVDLGVFDQAVMPAVDRPIPGGPGWPEVTAFLDGVISHSPAPSLIIMSGLEPSPTLHASDFLAAKLLYRMLSRRFRPA